MSRTYNRVKHLNQLWDSYTTKGGLAALQLDRFLATYLKANGKFGSQDRKWYTEAVFQMARYFELAQNVALHNDSTVDFSWIFSAALFKIKSTANINGSKSIPSFFLLDEELETLYNDKLILIENYIDSLPKDKLETLFIQESIPLSFLPSLKEAFPKEEELISFIQVQNKRAPIWIRVNPAHKEAVFKELSEKKISFQKYSEISVSLFSNANLRELESFKKGDFEIQDLASQCIVPALQIQANNSVWDACAGGGGKTLHMGTLLKNKGVIYASDIREYKFSDIEMRKARTQIRNIEYLTWQGDKLPDFGKDIKDQGGFDRILVDAPCSSSGTWRRNPDAKYRLIDFDSLKKTQLMILSEASRALKQDGLIAYATCSWLCEENEVIVKAFLESNPSFQLISSQRLGCPTLDSDSMFVAIIKKN